MIRALLFDADEVLQWPAPRREATLADELGVAPGRIADLVARIHEVEDTTLTGERDFLEALRRALRSLGLVDHALRIRDWLNWVELDHALLDDVSTLRARGYVCALATNQQPFRANFMADELGYRERFERCFFSCELGLAKPDPRYFGAMLESLRLDGSSALFIDDKPQNIEGARSAGLHAERFVNARDGGARAQLRALFERYGVTH